MSYAAASARNKAPEAFRTISEVADELQVPQHVLRFWESRFSQVRPVKRAGSRRYYRPDDIDLLRGIRALLYGDGFTVKGVQKILREKGARYVIEIGRSVVPANVKLVRRRDVQIADDSGEDASDDFDDKQNVVAIGAHALQADIEQYLAVEVIEETPQADADADCMAREERDRLQALLDELLGMKARLQAART